MKESTTTRGGLERFWVVTDPTPESEIGDILFETDVRGFVLQVRGGLDEDRRPTIFADRESAEADAMARLAVVRGLSAIADGVVRGNVRDATKLQLLDDSGDVVFETKLERMPR